MRTKYKNPPINELIIGVYFKEPVSLMRAEHVGLYWSSIKHEYPNSKQNMMIGNIDIQVPNELFPLPRFWFSSDDDVYLIQVQRNAFLLNWRKRDHAYPHYEQLKARFDENYKIFTDFLSNEFSIVDPASERCELNYINLVEDNPYFQSFADVPKVIPAFAPPLFGKDSQMPSDFNLAYVYPLDSGISLTLNVQSRRNRNTGKDTLYFEFRSTGALSRGTKLEADALFDRAHATIGEAFNGLTSPEIQQEYWKPMEN
jgi:uncharacterized protein (TIGR04255 family)